jgi:HupE / UreJ protein
VFIDADFDGVASSSELAAATTTISSAVLAQITLSRGGETCRLAVTDLAPVQREEQDFLSVSLSANCPKAGLLSVGGALFMSGDAAQRVILSVRSDDRLLAGVINASSTIWHEPLQASAWSSFAHFIGEGVWHVIIGYDHIAFVLLLLLPSVLRTVDGRWQGATGLGTVTRDVVTIVTAFTIAHSTTLALAVTGTVVLPSQPIEVAIALSIAVAAFINLMPRLSGWRLPLAFGFGLVHGFGFANVLGELDASGTPLMPLLAGFNVGVELAQLGIVAVVLPLIYLARSQRWYSGGVLPLGSCALGAAGVVWLIQRI